MVVWCDSKAMLTYPIQLVHLKQRKNVVISLHVRIKSYNDKEHTKMSSD